MIFRCRMQGNQTYQIYNPTVKSNQMSLIRNSQILLCAEAINLRCFIFKQFVINLNMQDSLELEYERTHSKKDTSPDNRPIKLNRFNNTESQESLLYSNCKQSLIQATYKEDTHRSPKFINLPLLEIEKPKIKVEEQKSTKRLANEGPARKGSGDLLKKQVNVIHNINPKLKLKIESPERYNPTNITQQQNNQRKTLENNYLAKMSKKIKELEYALQIETMSCEELRSKICILNETLEKNLKEFGWTEFFKLKNTGKQSHIDLYLEMQKIRQQMDLKDKELSRIQIQNDNLIKHLSLRNSEIEKCNKKIKMLENQAKQASEQLKKLSLEQNQKQENESLMLYIQQQKKQSESMRKKISDLEEQLLTTKRREADSRQQQNNRLRVIEDKITNQFKERELQNLKRIQALETQIDHMSTKIQSLQTQQIQFEKIKEQYEYDIVSQNQIIQVMETKILEYQNILADKQQVSEQTPKNQKSNNSPSISSSKQTPVSEKRSIANSIQNSEQRAIDRLRWQIQEYKKQCQYYHQQYLEKMKESGEFHALKLRFKNEMQYLKTKLAQYAKTLNEPELQTLVE